MKRSIFALLLLACMVGICLGQGTGFTGGGGGTNPIIPTGGGGGGGGGLVSVSGANGVVNTLGGGGTTLNTAIPSLQTVWATVGSTNIQTGDFYVYSSGTSSNYGAANFGRGAFDGVTAGFFVGSTNGTTIAVNNSVGFTGNGLSIQKAGVSIFSVNANGDVGVGLLYPTSKLFIQGQGNIDTNSPLLSVVGANTRNANCFEVIKNSAQQVNVDKNGQLNILNGFTANSGVVTSLTVSNINVTQTNTVMLSQVIQNGGTITVQAPNGTPLFSMGCTATNFFIKNLITSKIAVSLNTNGTSTYFGSGTNSVIIP